MTLRVFCWCVCLVFASLAAHARAYDPPTPAQVAAAQKKFAEELARDTDLAEADVLATLAKARYQQSIIDAISRPAESKTWREYRPIFLTQTRIDGGVAFYRANRSLFDRVEKEFGVPAQILVAIIGVETNYGRTPTRYRVLDALTTLGFYYPPRADFFRGELRQLFLLHGANFPYPIESLMGSYAGAMGWGQFMPSSIRDFAVDADDDGHINLVDSLPDIVASVANYFARHGWVRGGPVAMRAQPDAAAEAITAGDTRPHWSLEQLEAWGYAPLQRANPGELTGLQTLVGANGPEYWFTFQNFYVITTYNRSPLYAMAVYQLAQAIDAGVQAADRQP